MKEDVLSMMFGVNTTYDVKEYLRDLKNMWQSCCIQKSIVDQDKNCQFIHGLQ